MTHQDAHELLTLALQLTATACDNKTQDPTKVVDTFVTCTKIVYEQYHNFRDLKIPGK